MDLEVGTYNRAGKDERYVEGEACRGTMRERCLMKNATIQIVGFSCT